MADFDFPGADQQPDPYSVEGLFADPRPPAATPASLAGRDWDFGTDQADPGAPAPDAAALDRLDAGMRFRGEMNEPPPAATERNEAWYPSDAPSNSGAASGWWDYDFDTDPADPSSPPDTSALDRLDAGAQFEGQMSEPQQVASEWNEAYIPTSAREVSEDVPDAWDRDFSDGRDDTFEGHAYEQPSWGANPEAGADGAIGKIEAGLKRAYRFFFEGGPAAIEPDLMETQEGANVLPGMTRRPGVLPVTFDAQTGEAMFVKPMILDLLVGGGGIGRAAPAAGTTLKAGLRLPNYQLPMDQASRMARARQMGFRIDIPVFHGTAAPKDFSRFLRKPPRRTVGDPLAEVATFVATNPEYASAFAKASALSGARGNERVLPLFYRSRNPGQFDSTGMSTREIATNILEAWDNGRDTVALLNYTRGLTGPLPRTTAIAVKDPSQLRSPFAVFDPSRWRSPDILAARAPAFVPTPTSIYEAIPDKFKA